MKPNDAESTFVTHYLRGTRMDQLTPESGFHAMMEFYRDVRADECDAEDDGDMLLFQWGTHDWGNGNHFELDITRQLMLPTGDDDILQLSLTFRYPESNELQLLKYGNEWCPSPDETESFRTYIHSNNAYLLLNNRLSELTVLHFGNAG